MTKQENRSVIIEAARQLFTKHGFDNITMEDIARQSGKGRRTVYAHFGSKYDLYHAVVENEVNIVISELQKIASMPMQPQEKIMALLFGRFRLLKDTVNRNGSLRTQFFRDIFQVEHVHKTFDEREKELLLDVILEGREKGVFKVSNPRMTVEMLQYCMRGFEVPYIKRSLHYNSSSEEFNAQLKRIIASLLNTIDSK
ncbi:MAG: TetR/AcrR family transcriptional regulator [Bacteroidaceae bacterium]|nr:TetR/AcrR family transcriptional regulator [Bacteroidaceae bacterium]